MKRFEINSDGHVYDPDEGFIGKLDSNNVIHNYESRRIGEVDSDGQVYLDNVGYAGKVSKES